MCSLNEVLILLNESLLTEFEEQLFRLFENPENSSQSASFSAKSVFYYSDVVFYKGVLTFGSPIKLFSIFSNSKNPI